MHTEVFDFNNIKWQLTDKEALKRCFSLPFKKNVKENRVREVFFTAASADSSPEYFVKVAKPERSFRKVKALFRNKVKSEFDSFLLLKEHDLPVVNYIGWGKKGQFGYLVTEALSGFVDVSELLENFQTLPADLFTKIILGTTDILCQMITLGIFHPDFHFGNLMGRETANKFELCLLDVYGIRQKQLKENEKLHMLQVLVGYLWNLDDNSRQVVLRKIADVLSLSPSEVSERLYSFWHKKMHIHYRKRLKKFVRRSSLMDFAKDVNGEWLLNKKFKYSSNQLSKLLSSEALVDSDEIALKSYSSGESSLAKLHWKKVFAAIQFSIPIIDYYGCLQKSNGGYVHFCQNLQKSTVDVELKKIPRDETDNFKIKLDALLWHLRMSGVDVDNIEYEDISVQREAGGVIFKLNNLGKLKFLTK